MRKFHSLILCLGILLLLSCNTENVKTPSTSDIELDFKFTDFDSQLFSIEQENLAAGVAKLEKANPAFSELFFSSILPINQSGQIDSILLSEFISDPSIMHLKDTVDLLFNKEELKGEFEQAFKFAKHYFPNWNTPSLYTLISGFAYQTFLFDDEEGDAIGVGLDFFLGSNYPYKSIDPNNPSFSSYQTRSFNRDHIVKKALEVWIEDKLAPLRGNSLVDHMIRNGKKLYVLDKLLPHSSDTIITEYTKEQFDWVSENELQIWAFFFDQNLFYENNMRKLNKYINPSPDAPGMPKEAPGRVANYMAWQIIEAYMDLHPHLSLEMLLSDSNAQSILDKSKFKPKKN